MWTLQDAKNRFSAVVDAALAGQPQEVSRRGKPAVVVLSAAEYARIHARIADIMAALRTDTGVTVDVAATDIQSMLQTPVIIVPLPPASKEALESAAALAKRMADQAHYARMAQAHLRRGTVDHLISTRT